LSPNIAGYNLVMITEAQISQFERDGAVTIDGPFSSEQIATTGELIGRLDAEKKLGGAADYLTEPVLLEIIQHPFLEEVAQQVLRSPQVEFAAMAARQKQPTPDAPFAQEEEHVDCGYSPEDLLAVPRRMLVSFLVWFTDVTLDRGPFMYRPGSHRQLAEHYATRPPGTDNYLPVSALPPLPYAEPRPIIARAGQISVLTTATVHSASVNTGMLPRRVMFIIFKSKGYDVPFNMSEAERRTAYLRTLHETFRPERRHILPL
jgi:ectoine hydroxylase-related dioxygenase (phytanoyl-CoA dioxygenase family)